MNTKIKSITTEILDIPIKRPHQFSALTINHQSYVLVRLQTENGIEGIGEGVTPGGPWWSGESVESIKLMIDTYLAPILIGRDPTQIELLISEMNRMVAANSFAKSAVEIALYDTVGKLLGVPVYKLVGGLYKESIPSRWALAIGKVDGDVHEAQMELNAGFHSNFKMKAGAINPDQDSQRVVDVAKALKGQTTVAVDPNGSWDEITTKRWLNAFEEVGIDFLEQPIPRWNIEGLADLTKETSIPIMADESVCSIQDALNLVKRRAVNIFSLKLPKHGGITNTKKVAAIAEAGGIACFGGTFLESSIGVAACLHVYCTIPNLTYGCELVGPKWLADDIVHEPIKYRDAEIFVPHGIGLGVNLDESKVAKYKRKESIKVR